MYLCKRVCFLGCPYASSLQVTPPVYALDTPMMFSHVCFHTKKRSHALTSHTNADIDFYMSKFKHYNYRYLVPLLTSLTQFCSVHIYGDWLLDMANGAIIYITCPSLNKHRHSGSVSLDILHTYCDFLICSHILNKQTDKCTLIRTLKI